MYAYVTVMNNVPMMSGNVDWHFIGLTLSYPDGEI